jgi:hypothetical protein
MREEIKLINKIIAEAVMHGADMGGSYDSNEEDLTEAITDWLKFKGVDNDYCVKKQEVRKLCGCWTAVWKILQICEKGGSEE